MLLDVITTGGTIGGLAYRDPAQPPDRTLFPESANPVADLLANGFAGLKSGDYSLFEFPPVDSKDIGAEHISAIAQRLVSQPTENFLITHGTDTILDTAALLYAHPASAGKRVILAGAMVPLLNGSASDGFQNLAFAIEHLICPAGKAPIGINIVLSDFDRTAGSWEPRLYPFQPGRYQKEYNSDRGDRSRLVEVGQFV